MKQLKLGDNVTLNVGDFVIIADNNNTLTYGWFCGQGRDGCTLQYYSIYSPGQALEIFKKWETTGEITWLADKFKKDGFTAKVFWKGYINTYNEHRILKIEQPDLLFSTNKELQERYNKSKEALIKVKFLNK